MTYDGKRVQYAGLSATCRNLRASTARARGSRISCSRAVCRACAGRGSSSAPGSCSSCSPSREKADALVRTYSGGQKRRLDVAMGLIHRPQVLFLDEPTTGLDPEARVAMWDELSRLASAESLTILLTTHYLEEADRLAERVAIVSEGKVVVDGTPEALKRDLRGDAVVLDLANGDGEQARAIVLALPDVHEALVEGRRVHSRVERGAEAVPGMLAALDGAGVDVRAVTVSRPSLDEVYLHYTGRDFHADDEAGT